MLDLTLPEPGSSVEVFEATSRRICGNFHVESKFPKLPFVGHMEAIERGSLSLHLIRIGPCVVERNRKALKQSPLENVFLIYQEAGMARIQNGLLETSLRTGDFVLVDATKTSIFDFDVCHSEQISVPLLRPDAIEFFGTAASAGMVFHREAPTTFAVRRALYDLVYSAGNGDPYETFMQTVLTAVRERMGCEDLGFSVVEGVDAVNRIVSRHFRDPDFDAPELAERLGVAPRALQRLFQMLGETPRQHILNVRLDAARQALLKPPSPGERLTISSIAFDSGFNDLSYFYRTFAHAFGTGPGEFRRLAHGGGQARAGSLPPHAP